MKIAIFFIGVGKYSVFFDALYKSIKKNFLPNTERRFFVFGDQEFLQKDVSFYKVPPPLDTKGKIVPRDVKLHKFHYIKLAEAELAEYDYYFYFDADCRVNQKVEQQDIIEEGKDLIGVLHPWHSIRYGGKIGKSRFEANPVSGAYVDPEKNDTSEYFQSCFWGASKSIFDKMMNSIISTVDKDYEISHVNERRICDEVHVNKFFVENKKLLKCLGTEYAHPGEGQELKKGKKSKWKGERIISHHNSAQNRTWRFAEAGFNYEKNSTLLISLPVAQEDPLWVFNLIKNFNWGTNLEANILIHISKAFHGEFFAKCKNQNIDFSTFDNVFFNEDPLPTCKHGNTHVALYNFEYAQKIGLIYKWYIPLTTSCLFIKNGFVSFLKNKRLHWGVQDKLMSSEKKWPWRKSALRDKSFAAILKELNIGRDLIRKNDGIGAFFRYGVFREIHELVMRNYGSYDSFYKGKPWPKHEVLYSTIAHAKWPKIIKKTTVSVVKRVYSREKKLFNSEFIDHYASEEGVFCMKRFPANMEDARVKYVFENLMK